MNALIKQYLWIWLGFATLPLIVHGILFIRSSLVFTVQDIEGILSSLAVAALWALPIRSRLSFALSYIVWFVLHSAQLESVIALGSSLDFAFLKYATDGTFLKGSMLHPSYPLFSVAAIAWGGFACWMLRPPIEARPRRWTVAIVLTSLLAVWLLPASSSWRGQHVLAGNLKRLSARNESMNLSLENRRFFVDHMRADLSGTSLLGERRKKNVILIMLESVSQASLENLAGTTLEGQGIAMPRLTQLAQKYGQLRTFFAHQRQTNRGEYAIFCGDYPNLMEKAAKMEIYPQLQENERQECFPKVLHRHGYHTVYLQAAPMAFMNKDHFMTPAGFEEVYGADWFENKGANGTWGVNDQSFFEQSLRMIEKLEENKNRPWHLSMLTVGTHHPYKVPEKYVGASGRGNPMFDSMLAADDAIADFVESLDKRGTLDDTILLITADESIGVGRSETFDETLTQQWIPMIVVDKGTQQHLATGRFGQSDIGVSILDYLGIDPTPSQMRGRSFFRRYPSEPTLFFANTYFQSIGMIDGKGTLTQCFASQDIACKTYERPDLFLSRGPTMSRETDPQDRERLLGFSQWNDRKIQIERPNLNLVTPGSIITIPPGPKPKMIYGLRYFDLKKDTQLRITFQLSTKQAIEARADLSSENGRKILHDSKSVQLPSGGDLEYSFSYVMKKDRQAVEPRFYISHSSNEPVEVKIDHAIMSVGRKDFVYTGRRGLMDEIIRTSQH